MSKKKTTEQKIELVRQMLAKAESTTPEEAEALTEAAEKIMLRLSITDAMLAANSEKDDSPMTSETVIFEGRYADALCISIANALNAFNTVYLLRYNYGKNKVGLKIHGRSTQVERTVLLANSLHLQAISAMSAWWRSEKDNYFFHTEHEKFKSRRQFLFSFGAGASERITSERKVAENEVTGSALVLVGEREAAEKFATQGMAVRRGRSRAGGSYSAAAAGKSAGQRANVGTTGVGGNSTKQLSR